MTEAILLAIEAVSFVVIVIIMAVMANTMAMTARERYAEYATLKALGFSNGFVALLIFAESLGIALVGGAARHCADVSRWPTRSPSAVGTLFPVFFVSRGDDADAARCGSWSSASSRPRFRRGARRTSASSTGLRTVA